MTLVPLPRAALVLLSLIAMAALSLRLFSYEFSIPSEGISGIATTLVPQAGIVILSEAPQDSLWSGLGDEWGGSATYLRTLLIHSGFLLGGTLLVLHAVTCRAPSLARPLLWLVLSGCLACCLVGGLTRAWANYATDTFFFSPTCCTPQAVAILGPGMVPPHVRLTVNASLVDLLAQVQTGFGYALALLSLTLTWALYSRLRHNPSPHQPAAESARPLARPRSD